MPIFIPVSFVLDDGSYHLSFGTHHRINFYYYHNKNYIYKNYPIEEVEQKTENILNLIVNTDAKDAFSDCVDVNIRHGQTMKDLKTIRDFISCDLTKADNIDWNCKVNQWNSTKRELAFFIQLNRTSGQNVFENFYVSIQCRMKASAAGNDEHSFLFQLGPLITTSTNLMSSSSLAVTERSYHPSTVPVWHSSFTMGQTSAVSVLICISIISIFAAVSCGCYHRRRIKRDIDHWAPVETK